MVRLPLRFEGCRLFSRLARRDRKARMNCPLSLQDGRGGSRPFRLARVHVRVAAFTARPPFRTELYRTALTSTPAA